MSWIIKSRLASQRLLETGISLALVMFLSTAFTNSANAQTACGGDTGVPCSVGSTGGDTGLPTWFPTGISVTNTGGSACIPGFGCFGGSQNWAGFSSSTGTISGPYLHQQIDNAACRVLSIPEGSFGALVMIAAGLTAIVAGALGSYKLALSTMSIGAGAWILRPIVALFFPIGCGGFPAT